jgi:FtsP/CotA-like multicopper oxidase with cupredoxin domain
MQFNLSSVARDCDRSSDHEDGRTPYPNMVVAVDDRAFMHPLHLHRHNFEITKIYGKETSGILKDTVLVKGFSRVDVDFVADNPGLTLFHCHQNLHMDFGFMRLFEYV